MALGVDADLAAGLNIVVRSTGLDLPNPKGAGEPLPLGTGRGGTIVLKDLNTPWGTDSGGIYSARCAACIAEYVF